MKLILTQEVAGLGGPGAGRQRRRWRWRLERPRRLRRAALLTHLLRPPGRSSNPLTIPATAPGIQ